MAEARVIEGEATTLREDLEAAFQEAGVPTNQELMIPEKKLPAEPKKEESKKDTKLGDVTQDVEDRKPLADPDDTQDTSSVEDDDSTAPDKKADSGKPAAKSKAPGTWSPTMRQKWDTIPTDVQDQILKREREISAGFNEIHKVKEFQKMFLELTAPYNQLFAADGNRPLESIRNMLSISNTLFFAPQPAKAATVAKLISTFGVDIPTLDAVLAKQVGASPETGGVDITNLVQQEVNRRVAPLMEGHREAEERARAAVQSDMQAFAQDPKNEYFEDVRELMADILDVAAARGKPMDLQTAYTRATMQHPEVSKLIIEKQFQERLAAAAEEAKQKKRKAVSVTGTPATPSEHVPGESLRADLEEAARKLATQAG